ncbi:DUF6030 family protein [Agrobacterium sp. rho-13.3]|uniref:DUF6030 family protein n=1 Tax=Agrobacterium sp. rho-13.3 TaxID=3072980 RepID=UPI002A116A76|nr:DUF6030 family protein [Agrobacterium sp. rho-13.3]MDX8311733.1 DUF6030 family protein [Agrobacterium sp. rho-13.3]
MLFASLLSLVLLAFDADGFGGAPATKAINPLYLKLDGAETFQISSPSVPVPSFNRQRCRGIADLSLASRPVFTERENGGWECVYVLEYSETGHSPSVFVQIRGLKAGTWSSFRLKLNFGSILSRQVLSARAAALVHALIGNREPIKGLAAELAEGHDFDRSFNRITLKYRQERLDNSRYNLTGVNASSGGR